MSAAPDAYNWYRALRPASGFVRIQTTATPDYDDEDVGRGRTYYYRAAAVTGGVEGPLSNTVALTIDYEGNTTMSTIERAIVFQGVQLIAETTPGQMPASPAPKRLSACQIMAIPKPMPIPYRPMGYKGHTQVQQGRETTDAKLTGILSYTELPYQLEALLTPAGAPAAVGTMAYTRTYLLSARNPETGPQTYTVETGSTQGAERFHYGFLKSFNIKTSEKEASLSGDMVGWPLEDAITLTTGAADVDKMPVDPSCIGFYQGDDPTAMTRILTPLETEVRLGGLWKENQFQDDSNPSYDSLVEMAPDFGFKTTVAHGSQALTLLSKLRTGQFTYIGMKARGPVIETGTGGTVVSQYGIDIILPCIVTSTSRQDKDGLYAHDFEFAIADSATFGLCKVIVTNKEATL